MPETWNSTEPVRWTASTSVEASAEWITSTTLSSLAHDDEDYKVISCLPVLSASQYLGYIWAMIILCRLGSPEEARFTQNRWRKSWMNLKSCAITFVSRSIWKSKEKSGVWKRREEKRWGERILQMDKFQGESAERKRIVQAVLLWGKTQKLLTWVIIPYTGWVYHLNGIT